VRGNISDQLKKYYDCFDSASFPCLLSDMTMLRNQVVFNIFKVTEIHNLHKFGAILLEECKVTEVFVPEPRFYLGDIHHFFQNPN